MTKFTTPRAAFWAGVREFLPIVLGVIPFGIVFGVAATDIGITPLEGIWMSMIMVAGAAQLVTIELLKNDAALWVILLSATIVNLRFVIYSASLTPYFRPYSLWWRLGLGYLLTDQPYALSIAYFAENPDAPHKQWYHLGHSMMLWTSWVISSALGVFLGEFIPLSWGFSFAIPLMFLGIAIPAIKDWTFVAAASVASLVALLAAPLPNNTGLLVAVACGIAVGVLLGDDETS
ncbi:MAG: AzlC family ABC transporter permease [Phototrophicaceae bacterium]